MKAQSCGTSHRQGSSCLFEAEEGVGAERAPRIEIWLEPRKEDCQRSSR